MGPILHDTDTACILTGYEAKVLFQRSDRRAHDSLLAFSVSVPRYRCSEDLVNAVLLRAQGGVPAASPQAPA